VAQVSHSKNIFVCLFLRLTRVHLIGLGLGLVAFGLGLVSFSFGGLGHGLGLVTSGLALGLVKVLAIVPTLKLTIHENVQNCEN